MPVQAVAPRIMDDYDATAPHRDEALRQSLIGTWELVSYKVEEKETGAFINPMGPAPRGRVVFTPDGWVAFNLEGSNRLAATTDADRAQLMKTLVAYIGRYRVEGDQWITSVQTAWAPEWVGTEQRRTVIVNGQYADVVTPWRKMPNWAAGRLSRSIIRFRRAGNAA
ncbi:lipocalin-like domain-containing protein [Acetobacter syzygii]|uniref:lipocalin-like domain-containing protein n=1 Tax=Acetobacter syzygii TaxID=146476 RepID=UPI0039E7BF85